MAKFEVPVDSWMAIKKRSTVHFEMKPETSNDLMDLNGNIPDYKIDQKKPKHEYRIRLVWRNIIPFVVFHIMALYALYLGIIGHTKIPTLIWYCFLTMISSFGILSGSHRLWSHRSYKANTPLKIVLMVLQTLGFESPIYYWARDHRVHHKHSDTDADPYNANRGFFFAHCGWFMIRKHPRVTEEGRKIDVRDLDNDPVVMFQRNHFLKLIFLIWGVIPTWLTVYFFNESIFTAFCGNMLRYVIGIHQTFLINSAAHLYGYRPYDKSINPCESLVYLLMGEGYHNYHHTFPWDYAAAELGSLKVWNPATAFIDCFAWIGWAYDLKRVDKKVVEMRMERTGERREQNRTNIRIAVLDMVWGVLVNTWIVSLALVLRPMFQGATPVHETWRVAENYPGFFKPIY